MSDDSLEEKKARAQQNIRDLRSKISSLDEASIELIIGKARTHYAWQDKTVSDDLIKRIYEIVAQGSTHFNSQPGRFVFVKSDEAKKKLEKGLKPANIKKAMSAPVTAIIAYDLRFWEKLPKLFPLDDKTAMFKDKEAFAEKIAFRNSSLQGAYLMLTARALGLDAGPMSGYEPNIIDEEFFPNSTYKSNFLCNIGYGDESAIFHKLPRLDFDEACNII
jgi:3-hydroxypropanoate dehydrogenase